MALDHYFRALNLYSDKKQIQYSELKNKLESYETQETEKPELNVILVLCIDTAEFSQLRCRIYRKVEEHIDKYKV